MLFSVVQSSALSLQLPTSSGVPHNPNKTLALETQGRQARPSPSKGQAYSARLARTPNSHSKTHSSRSRPISSVNRNNRNNKRTCSASHSSKLSNSNPSSRAATCLVGHYLGATPSSHSNNSNSNLNKALLVGSARSVHQTNSSNSHNNSSLIFSGQQIQVMHLEVNPRRSRASEILAPQAGLGLEEQVICLGRNHRRHSNH